MIFNLIPSALLLLAAIPAPEASVGWLRAGLGDAGAAVLIDREKKWMLTCYHLTGDEKRVEVFFPERRDGRLVAERGRYVSGTAELRKAGLLVGGKVVRTDEVKDLALVELDALPAEAAAMRMATQNPKPGEAVRSIGHRYDSELLWARSFGVVRQVARQEGYFWRGKKLAKDAEALLLQLPVNAGDSGGPVMNERDELVGIVSAVRWREGGVSMGISAREVSSFLEIEVRGGKHTAPDPQEEATAILNPKGTEKRPAAFLIDAERGLLLTCDKAVGTLEKIDVRFRDGTEIEAKVLARDPVRGLVLLQVPPQKGIQPLRISEAQCAPGDKVRIVNHPMGVDAAWLHSAGIVRQTGKVALDKPEKGEASCLLLQVPSHGRSSGAAVVNEKGDVVGLLLEKESPQQQLGYAATATEIWTFLKDQGKP